VLLIDRDADRRQWVAAALVSAGMVVTAHATSAEVLADGIPMACDVLLVGQILPREAMSRLLLAYPSVVLCVDPGQEPDAARALRSGTFGVVVRDTAQAYLPLLLAQLEAASRRTSQQWRDALDPDARQRSLRELSPDWYWEQDEEFRLVRIQASARTRIGLTPGELLGRRRWELPTLNVSHTQWQAHQAALQAHEVFHDFEMQLIDGHGEVHWISVSGAPLFDAQKRFLGYHGISRNITGDKQAQDQIDRLAFQDELTGLPNRRLLMDRLQRALVVSERHGQTGALLFIDLDNFKDLNDTRGHEAGDLFLQQVAHRLLGSVRGRDTVARLGGDEFVVILEELGADLHEAATRARKVAQKITTSVHQPYMVQHHKYHGSASIGVVMFRGHQHPIEELLQQADLAMYQAKGAGRNTFCFFDPDMQHAFTARAALEAHLRAGLQRDELRLHYQLQLDTQDQPQGVEALVRWEHPQRGLVGPSEFIPLAEKSGLILPLGRWVLRRACEQLVAWASDPAKAHLTMAVNVSAKEFRHPDFIPGVLTTLADTGASPHLLKLELTESLLLEQVDEVTTKMHVLRQRGIRFALDDFGTGYSSLGYLKSLPLRQLKIDQVFVRDILEDPRDAAIACAIITLAHRLGLEVLAEGVETAGQREFLARHGCQQFQGHLFGLPAPAETLFPAA
jgi:diguanylate cyclase (GGDEF)-like protein/PAS domain S-box-containing protein